MAEVKVTELAKTVGASVDRLLSQMKEAGLPHISPEDMVSDEEKQALLGYLKGLHGEKGGEPKKITLRRKTVSTLKTGNRRTVNIEVRKKRTYVKRSEEDIQAQAELESDVKARQEVEQAPEPLVEPEVVVSPESNPEDVVSKRSSGTDDIEERRLAAIANRRRADEEQRALAEQKGKEQLEEEARKAAEAASALASEEAKKAGKTTKQVPTPASEPVQDKGRRHAKSQDDDEDKLAKKAKKPLGKPGKKKGRLRLTTVKN